MEERDKIHGVFMFVDFMARSIHKFKTLRKYRKVNISDLGQIKTTNLSTHEIMLFYIQPCNFMAMKM
jgi:hypothetical protein